MKFKYHVQFARKYKHYKFHFEVPELVAAFKEKVAAWVIEENNNRKETYKEARKEIIADPEYQGHPRRLARALKELDDRLTDEEAYDSLMPVTEEDYKDDCYNNDLRQRIDIDPITGMFEFELHEMMDIKDLLKKGNVMHNRRFNRKKAETDNGCTLENKTEVVANEATKAEVL